MNPKYHLLLAVAALGLGACSTDDTCTEPENGGHKLSFTVAEDLETRTTLEKGDFLRWLKTDTVGSYTVGQMKNSNVITRPEVNNKPVTFVGFLTEDVLPKDWFYAYYPYNAAQSSDPSAVKLSIPVEQKQTQAGVYNGQSHPLVALPKQFEGGNDAEGSLVCNLSNVRFRQLGAIVELKFYSSREELCSQKIHSVTFKSDNDPLAGNFTFDLTAVSPDPDNKDNLSISGYESKEVTTTLDQPVAIPATKEEAALIYLTIAPGEYSGKFIVKTDVTQYELVLKKSIDFGRATITGLPANLLYAKQIPIEFEDPTVKQICIANWDTNNDGGLSNPEAAAVTSIEEQFAGKSISSFNELQYFTGLKSIGSSAFNGCSSLTAITIPDGVTAIGSSAFNGCSSLTNIHIPDGVTAIENDTFNGCSSLTSITVPDKVAMIGANAFKGCSSLTSIRVPSGTIGANAFEGCEYLTSVNMSDGVTAIGDQAFCNCGSLTSITIPKSVTSIGERVFVGCYSLSHFYGTYASANNRCLIQNSTLLICAPVGRNEFDIPEGVTAIGDYAFCDCSGLKNITIPAKVIKIGEYAFRGCSSLAAITIPDGVATIETGAFYECSALKSLTIPANVTTIEMDAFNGCGSLRSVYCKPTNPPTLGSNAFLWTMSPIYVPAASVEAYKTAEGWSKYADQIFEE